MKLRKIVTIFSLSLLLTACANNNSAPNDASNGQAEIPIVNESSPESSNNPSSTEQSADDCSITIGNVSFSIHESKQDILAKNLIKQVTTQKQDKTNKSSALLSI